jgi:hypothetical protein
MDRLLTEHLDCTLKEEQTSMADMDDLNNYRVQELNPFLEWHHHGSTADRKEAMNWAKSLSCQLKRSVRVLDHSERIIVQYDI